MAMIVVFGLMPSFWLNGVPEYPVIFFRSFEVADEKSSRVRSLLSPEGRSRQWLAQASDFCFLTVKAFMFLSTARILSTAGLLVLALLPGCQRQSDTVS